MIKIFKDTQNRFTAISPKYYPKIRKKSTPWHGPKSTACFFNILEKKMPGGETPPLPGHEGIFCQGRGEVPSPANVDLGWI
jgi:hypothetical protein